MERTTTSSISLPKSLEVEVQKEAKREHRTKSGLIQEAIRFYLENKRWKKLQQEMGLRANRLGITSEDDVERLVDEIRG